MNEEYEEKKLQIISEKMKMKKMIIKEEYLSKWCFVTYIMLPCYYIYEIYKIHEKLLCTIIMVFFCETDFFVFRVTDSPNAASLDIYIYIYIYIYLGIHFPIS